MARGCLGAFAAVAVLFVLFVSSAAPVDAESFYVGTPVTELTAQNFDKTVLKSNDIWMIEFYAPWCGHCKQLKPAYLAAAGSTKGVVAYGAVNCDDHNGLCGQYGIKGFPTLKTFGQDKKKPADYQGDRSAKGLANALIGLLPPVVPVTDATFGKFLGATPDLPHAILFTEKATTAPLLKSLSLHFRGRMLIGEAKAKAAPGIADSYRVETFPKLIVLPAKKEGEDEPGVSVPYVGEIKAEALRAFLETHAAPAPADKGKTEKPKAKKTEGEAKPAAAADPPPAKAPKTAAPAKTVAEITVPEELESLCYAPAGFCAVLVLPTAPTAADRVSFGQLAAHFASDPIQIVFIKEDTRSLLAAALLSAGAPAGKAPKRLSPAIVVINPKKKKFAAASIALGAGLTASVGPVLDRLLGGDLPMVQANTLPAFG